MTRNAANTHTEIGLTLLKHSDSSLCVQPYLCVGESECVRINIQKPLKYLSAESLSLLSTLASSHVQSPMVESDTFLSGRTIHAYISSTVFATSILSMPFDASVVCYILCGVFPAGCGQKHITIYVPVVKNT